MTTVRTTEQRSAISAVKAERERDKAEAMREYEAERLALQVNTARLRAMRLAREAAQTAAAAAAPAKPAKKAKTTKTAKKKTTSHTATPAGTSDMGQTA